MTRRRVPHTWPVWMGETGLGIPPNEHARLGEVVRLVEARLHGAQSREDERAENGNVRKSQDAKRPATARIGASEQN